MSFLAELFIDDTERQILVMRKKTSLTFLGLLLFLNFGVSQQVHAQVEDKLFSIQSGLFGVWGNYEHQLQNNIVLRTELGFELSLWYYDENNVGIYLIPAITIEPRWYYNLNKRKSNSKRIDGNSGNYLSIFLRHHPDWFIISNYETGGVMPDLSIIPTWGLRRRLSEHLNFETAIGLGYRYYFACDNNNLSNYGEIDLNFTVRLGYDF